MIFEVHDKKASRTRFALSENQGIPIGGMTISERA